MCNNTDSNCTSVPNIGESQQGGKALISDYIYDTTYTEHIAETLLILLLCALLLLYKIIDIFRKLVKCNKDKQGARDYVESGGNSTCEKEDGDRPESSLQPTIIYCRDSEDDGDYYPVSANETKQTGNESSTSAVPTGKCYKTDAFFK